MSTKEQLIETIQSYLKIEKEIKLYQKELKERRAKLKQYSEILVNIMKTNDIDCFDITDGKIVYSQSKVKSSLSKKHIMECLNKYFEKFPNIDTDDVTNYILENRQETLKDNIKHKPNKN
jgi:hypothetical protein